jgi:hypothetical protein
MEIARLEPFPIVANYSGLEPNIDYTIPITDDHSVWIDTLYATSDENGNLAITLSDYFSKYDDEYNLKVYDPDNRMVLFDTLTIMRPYFDPKLVAETEEELADIVYYERMARAIITSITGGFQFQLQRVEAVGTGADFLSLPYRLNNILQVYENNILVYDAEDPTFTNIRDYFITFDQATIAVTQAGTWDRKQGRSTRPQIPSSDSFTMYNTNDSPNIIMDAMGTPSFPNGWDYQVYVECGYPLIPADISYAAQLIVNDMKCNNLPYINQYISQYKSDQFNINFHDLAFKDTGNRIADRILSAYVRPVYRLGVL